jgi:hypothetical protein
MSISQKLINILDELEDAFQVINGGADYNNNIKHNNILRKYVPIEGIDSFPAISISSLDCVNSSPMDLGYTTYEGTLQAEIFGYVQEEGANTLDKVLKLALDMEKALYNDVGLNGNVWNLSLDILTATNQANGVVRINLRAQLEYIK